MHLQTETPYRHRTRYEIEAEPKDGPSRNGTEQPTELRPIPRPANAAGEPNSRTRGRRPRSRGRPRALLGPAARAACALTGPTSSQRLLALSGTANDGPFDRRAVSARVNSPRNDDAALLVPLDG